MPEEPTQDIETFAEIQAPSVEAATADAVAVLENLVAALRKHHKISSKSEARAIIRLALMEI